MIRSMIRFISLATCIVMLAGWSVSYGAIIASDSFETYATGSALNGQGESGGGWAGGWTGSDAGAPGDVSVVSGGLSYSAGGITIAGGAKSAELTDTNGVTQTLNRGLTNVISATDTDVYFRFLIKAQTGTVLSAQDAAYSGFNNSAGLQVAVGGVFPTATTAFHGCAANSSSYANVVNWGTMTVGDVYLMVGRLWRDPNLGIAPNYFNTLDLWVNPDTTDDLTSYDMRSMRKALGGDGSNIGSVTFTAFSPLEATDLLDIDEYVVGQTWNDVIPEPATFTLLALASLGLLRRRR